MVDLYSKVIKDLTIFKASCNVNVSSRMRGEIRDVADKVYTRDFFGSD